MSRKKSRDQRSEKDLGKKEKVVNREKIG